jgi:hypothetical protein
MLHGGHKYLLEGVITSKAAAIAKMPQRWQACFEGRGEIDLRSVEFLSETQVMWPAGSLLSAAAVLAAAKLVNATPTRLKDSDVPEALKHGRKAGGPIYSLPEKVLDMRSLLCALAENLQGRVFTGEVSGVLPDGHITVAGQSFRAKAVIFAAGTGNERAFDLVGVSERRTQRRPLRQVMVRPMSHSLFGHGIVARARPRITVTSHPCGAGEYIWYLGGNVAEKGAHMDESEAVRFAERELRDIFPASDWDGKQWATWYGDRAEPAGANDDAASGPLVHQHGRILLVWPTKLTFAPALADCVFASLAAIDPGATSPPPQLAPATVGSYPWENAAWQSVP